MLGLIGPEHYLRLTSDIPFKIQWSEDAKRCKSEQMLAHFARLREKLT